MRLASGLKSSQHQGLGKKHIFSGSSSCCLLQLALGVQDIEQIVRETCMNMMTDRTIGILHHVTCSGVPVNNLANE